MKISVSNIAWKSEYDESVYAWLKSQGISGVEIAPTKLMGEKPYDRCEEAQAIAKELKAKYDLTISSMQSIWYQRNENIFASKAERNELFEYTKKAIDYAKALQCNNLVFGCPRNRNIPDNITNAEDIAYEFFKGLGDYAYEQGTVLAMEANPPMYNTNFCNVTADAVELVKRVNSKGFRLNLDFGTIISNEENVKQVAEYAELINHVHISEPGLAPIQKRETHCLLAAILKDNNYNGFVSLEIKTSDDIEEVKRECLYLKEVFG